MALRDNERYYWLKLHRDFFKRHDIRVLEEMPRGKETVLLLLKLMTESVDHGGALRFSDKIPYTEAMLACVTNTEEAVVHDALQILQDLGMAERKEDGTLFLPAVAKLLGSETYAAKRKRDYRQNTDLSDRGGHCLPEIDIDKEIETDTETDTDIEINDSCAEMKLISAPEAIPLVDKTVFEASEEEIEAWQKAFPAVDVRQQLRKMRAWCLANPKLCKTRKGVKRFIVSWLSREQDRGHPGMAVKAQKEPRPFVPTEL